jgi:hypothetical protein
MYVKFNLMSILQSDWLIHREQHWLYLINWVGIVTLSIYSFANDYFNKSHVIIIIKIEEVLNFVMKFNL